MATAAALAHPPLLTSEEFLDWLEPGVQADLIGGEVFMHSPVNLRHARLLNFLDHLLRSFVEFAEGAARIDSASIAGFWVKRDWLNPEKPPNVSACLAEILKPRKRGR